MREFNGTEKNHVLVLLSGGIDSASCAHFYKSHGYTVRALFVDYGQKALPMEAKAVSEICSHLELPLKRVSINGVQKKTAGEILGRNAGLLFIALMEFQEKTGLISIGIHSGTCYYDCSYDFISRMQTIFENYSNGCIKISVPFLYWNKTDIFNYFQQSGIPIEFTYSCENGKSQPCGSCLSCKDIERFYAR